jgi:hypothetical protein
MEEEIEELYVEGLATYGGPESCVDDRKGVAKRWQGTCRPGY